MIETLKKKFMETPPLFRYLVNSCIVTVIDTIIVWILAMAFGMDIVIANTIGVVSGFLLDYLLSVLFVFEGAKGKGGFAIYLWTFLFGLLLADILIWLGENRFFVHFSENMNFLLSKGISIVIPFFILYALRKVLYYFSNKRHNKEKNK